MATPNELTWLARHHGVISKAEATDLRIGRGAIRRRLERGEWVRMHRGVYRHHAVPLTWEAKARAATLSSGGLLSHRAAARLWGIEGFTRARVEVVVPEGRQRTSPGYLLHQSRQFDLAAPRTRGGVATTGIERTILDLAAVVTPRRLGLVLDSVLRQKRTRWEAVAATLARHSVRGRNGCGPLRELLDQRYGSATPDSDWNRAVALLLEDAGLLAPALEFEIRDQGRFVARVDLAYPDRLIAVECDSRRFHDADAAFEHDRQRRNRLVELGWRVFNITWRMFVDAPQEIVASLEAALSIPSAVLTDRARHFGAQNR